MTKRINNPESCICCGRRADGVAVGKPGRMAWNCFECGSDMAKIALAMHTREFDAVEKRAASAVAEEIGADDLAVPRVELPAFILWVIERFAETMRKDMEAGAPPF